MFDLDSPWTGTIVIIIVSTLALAIVTGLATMFIDPALPRDLRAAAVSCWFVASVITGLFSIFIRHTN